MNTGTAELSRGTLDSIFSEWQRKRTEVCQVLEKIITASPRRNAERMGIAFVVFKASLPQSKTAVSAH